MKTDYDQQMQDFLAKAKNLGIKVTLHSQEASRLFEKPDRESQRVSQELKVKLFTHTDTDGVSCGVLGKLAFKDNIDIDYCSYEDINEKVGKLIDGYVEKYDKIFITDLSVNEEMASAIEKKPQYIKDKFTLLDHHITAEWLNDYEWADVKVSENGVAASGTSLFYEFLQKEGRLGNQTGIADYVELVRQYDTWEWKEKENYHAKQLNDLFYILGRERFVARFIADCSPNFTEAEQLLLDIEQEKIDRYIKARSKDVMVRPINEYTVGIVYAEQYISELGNALAESYRQVDFIAIVNMSRSISYRTVKDNINVGEIAAFFGGGGHQKAAGSPILREIKEMVAEMVFSVPVP
jgi:uncharacterized protein